MTPDNHKKESRPPKEFFGRWKYSKRLGCWVWRWKFRRPRTVAGDVQEGKP